MRSNLTAALFCTFAAPVFANPALAAGKLFDRLDSDANGTVTVAEITAAKTAQFARLDANGDAALDAGERAAAKGRAAKLGNLSTGSADRLDKNGDGSLTLQEFTATGRFFVLLDIDGDAALSRAEFDRAIAAFAN
jgi:EF hand